MLKKDSLSFFNVASPARVRTRSRPTEHLRAQSTAGTALSRSRRRFLNGLLVALVALAALSCDAQSPNQQTTLFAFGTRFDVTVVGAEREHAHEFFRDADQRVQRWHRDWHAWEAGELARINERLNTGQAANPSPPLLALINAGIALNEASLGYFDPGAGKLFASWGFHTSDYPVTSPPPDRHALTSWREARPSIADLTVDGSRVASTRTGVQLDFGGLAKGMALARLAPLVREHGLSGVLMDFGGDVLAVGNNGSTPWRVAIADPTNDVPLGVVELRSGESLFTSGSQYRYRTDGDERRGHILNPKSGEPETQVLSATVLDDDPLVADAAATAIVAGGVLNWRRIGASMGVDGALVVSSDGSCSATSTLLARLGATRCKAYTAADPG